VRQIQAIAPFGHIWTVAEVEGLPFAWLNLQPRDISGGGTPPSESISGGDTLIVTDALSLGQVDLDPDDNFFAAFFEPVDAGTAISLVGGHSVSWKVRHQPTADFLNDTYGLGAVVDTSSFRLTYPDVSYVLVFRIEAQFPFNRELSESQISARPAQFWMMGPLVFP